MKKIFLPIMLCALMVLSSVLLACEPIGEHKHEFIEVPQVEATCSEAGIRKHRECRICRYWFDEEGNLIDEREFIIPATGVHKFVEVPKAEATCGEAGVDAHRECEQCDKWFDAEGNQIDERDCVIPATGVHKFVEVPKADATCGEAGVKAHKECEECDKWFNEQGEAIDKSSCTIPATGEHNFENGTCTVCGAKDPEWKEPTLPEGLVGKYYDESNRENYIEVSKDKSVNVHIDNADNTYTVTKVEDNKVTLSNNAVIEFNADAGSITYNEVTYYDEEHYPAEPELVVPAVFNGTFVSSDTAYIFDGTENVTFRDLDGNTKQYVITAATNEEGNITVTVQSADEPETTIKFTYSTQTVNGAINENVKPDNGGKTGTKRVFANNIPDELVGKWTSTATLNLDISKDGFMVVQVSAKTRQLWAIIEYNESTGEIEAVLGSNAPAGKYNFKYDRENDVVIRDPSTSAREFSRVKPAIEVPEDFNGTFVAGKVSYIFDGTANVTLRRVDGSKENWEIIEASSAEDNIYVKIKSKDDLEAEEIKLTIYKANGNVYVRKDDSTTNHARKLTLATNIPSSLYGKYENAGTIIEVTEDGYIIRANSQYLIVSYDETEKMAQGLYGSGSSIKITYDEAAGTILDQATKKTYTRVQEEPGIELPVGMAGKYLDEKNKDNYIEVSASGFKAHIGSTDTTQKISKVEGNTVTLENNETLEYNASDFSITYNGNKYILESKYPATNVNKYNIPEYFFGKYVYSSNYIEIRIDDTVTIKKSTTSAVNGEYKITDWDGATTITITQNGSGTVRYLVSMEHKANGVCSLSFDYSTYTKQPLPVACTNLPDTVSGKYTGADGNAYYEFNGTDVVFHRNGQTDTKWVVTNYDEDTKTITIASESNANSTQKLTYDPDKGTVTNGSIVYTKAAA